MNGEIDASLDDIIDGSTNLEENKEESEKGIDDDDDDMDFALIVQTITNVNQETLDLTSGFRRITWSGGIRQEGLLYMETQIQRRTV